MEEKKKIITGLINSYSVNIPVSNPTSNANDLSNNSKSLFATNNSSMNTPSELEKKINQLSQIVESVSIENQKLKPMLKSVADMQYFTFQKLKSYETSLEELKMKMSNSGIIEVSSTKKNEPYHQNIKTFKNPNLNSQMNFRFVEP